MKLLLFPLLLILITLFIPTATATHSNSTTITFDKNSYEFGDDMLLTVQLTQPWESDAGSNTSIAIGTVNVLEGSYIRTYDFNHTTGIALINHTLNYMELDHTKPMRLNAHFITMHENAPNIYSPIFHTSPNTYNVTLNSDHQSIVLDYTRNRDYILTYLSDIDSLINSLMDQIIQLNNTIISQQTNIDYLNNTITTHHP